MSYPSQLLSRPPLGSGIIAQVTSHKLLEADSGLQIISKGIRFSWALSNCIVLALVALIVLALVALIVLALAAPD